MRFDLPEGQVVPVTTIDVRMDPAPHPFEVENRAAIDANWALEQAANPALFDGTMALLSEIAYAAGRLTGRCHAVRYATLLLWRKHRPPSAHHAFAHAVLTASDGALVAVRMGPHTANAGKVYFAAGSFEEEDFRDGRVDVDLNMIREVGEETGLDLTKAERDPHHHMASANRTSVIFRRYRLSVPAADLAARIDAYIASEAEPELAGAVVIRSPQDLPEGLSAHMRPIIDWHFATDRRI